jgi:hypothetical protein
MIEIKTKEHGTLLHQGILQTLEHDTNIEYVVKGTIFLKNKDKYIKEIFEKVEDANLFLEKMINKHPVSEFILNKISTQELKLYV